MNSALVAYGRSSTCADDAFWRGGLVNRASELSGKASRRMEFAPSGPRPVVDAEQAERIRGCVACGRSSRSLRCASGVLRDLRGRCLLAWRVGKSRERTERQRKTGQQFK